MDIHQQVIGLCRVVSQGDTTDERLKGVEISEAVKTRDGYAAVTGADFNFPYVHGDCEAGLSGRIADRYQAEFLLMARIPMPV